MGATLCEQGLSIAVEPIGQYSRLRCATPWQAAPTYCFLRFAARSASIRLKVLMTSGGRRKVGASPGS